MHTLIGPDDSQTQWLPVPFVAIALGTNSLVGCCLGDGHRGSNNIALLVSICKKMDQGSSACMLSLGLYMLDLHPRILVRIFGGTKTGPLNSGP